MSVIEKAVQRGSHDSRIPQHFPQSSTGRFEVKTVLALVAAHDDFQQILGRGERQLAHAEIVEKRLSTWRALHYVPLIPNTRCRRHILGSCVRAESGRQ
jgi:hypothetical protein